MQREAMGKIALFIVLLFFCSSAFALAAVTYHPEKTDINWEFRADPNIGSNSPAIVYTSPGNGEAVSGQIVLVLKYKDASGHCDWSFDGIGCYSMMYYGEEHGVQEAQGIFDTRDQENGPHVITFRIWLLNGSKLERVVNVEITN